MRVVTIGIVCVLTAGAVKPADPDSADRKGIVRRAFSPFSAVWAAAGAGVNQATDTPHEWGQGAAGFGRRLASAFGKHLVKTAIQYPVARFRHEEMSFRPSGEQGFRPRLKYALLSTVITRKTTTGKRTVSTSELAGAFGSGLISRLWQPASTGSVAAGFASGGITLGVDAGGHVLREFWPEIRHPRRAREPRQN